MGTIWAYCRVSTAKEEQEESLEAQESWARAFAAELGSQIRVFREQASAKTTIGRPVFQGMMSEIAELQKSKRPTHLVVTALDRLSRSLRDTLNVVEALREYKVLLYQRGLGVIGTETFPEKAALAGLSLAGEAENYSRSLRAKQSWERRRSQGKPTSNKVPYGLQLQGERDVPIRESARWVASAFQWYDAGLGTFTIARRFANGAPAHTWLTSRVGADGQRIRKTREKTKWDSTRIVKLLKQRRYRGTIVDEIVFDRVQERLAQIPRPSSRRIFEYPLSGTVKCSGCGRSMHGRAAGGNKTYRVVSGEVREAKTRHRIRYYSCYVCNYELNAERLEASFFKDVASLGGDERLLQRWITGEQPRNGSRVRLSEIKRLERECSESAFHQRIDRVIDLAIAGGLGEAELRRQVERVKAEFGRSRARLKELTEMVSERDAISRSLDRARGLLSRFYELFNRATYDVKRALVRELVDALGGATASRNGLKWTRSPKAGLKRKN